MDLKLYWLIKGGLTSAETKQRLDKYELGKTTATMEDNMVGTYDSGHICVFWHSILSEKG